MALPPLDTVDSDHPDRRPHAAKAPAMSSPSLALLTYIDWATHLAVAPGKRLELLHLALSQSVLLSQYAGEAIAAGTTGSVPPRQTADDAARAPDRRFAAPEWQAWPYNVMQESFRFAEQWWLAATTGVRGMSPHDEHVISFAAREMLQFFSPRNFLATNPEVLRRTQEEYGANLLRGSQNFLEDLARHATGAPEPGTEDFIVGRDVAVTPGKVVLRNQLMELIQYTPSTAQVHPEPILIVPAWIMKYYVLDLSPDNSLVKYLVDQGYTVFCVSWKNPGIAERDMGMDDYLALGVHAPLAAVNAIVPDRKVHATGYCLGGTLLAIAAAAMARDGDDRLATVSLLAAQTDFSEPGELSLFIDESQVAILEAQMAETGYLGADQMAAAFQLLRSDYLIWARLIKNYLMGERDPMRDLMAWNADATRMPARMHSEYLRRLYLDNDLSQGRYHADGQAVALADISLPLFCLGTQTDHVAPWHSVYKLHLFTPAQITFVLTNGGHNAGVVSEPGNPRRHFQMLAREPAGNTLSPDEWIETAPTQAGSWWPAWVSWLTARSAKPVKPPKIGASRKGYAVLGDAPGDYVLEK